MNALPGAGPDGEAGQPRLGTRLLDGAFWLVSGTVARVGVRLVVVALLARLLVPEDFGLVAAASIFVAFAELFATSGIVFVLVQRPELEARHIRTAFTANLFAGIAASLVIVALSGLIADLLSMPQLAAILTVLALLFPLNAAAAVSQKLLERELGFGRVAAAETVSYIVGYALIAVPLAYLGFGVWSLVFAQLGAAAIRAAWLLLAQPHSVRLAFEARTYLEMMRTGAGYSIVRYALYVAHKGDYFVVGRWLGAGSLGLYERAYVLMDLSNTLLASSIQTILFPAFAKLQEDKKLLALAFERASVLLALIFLPAGAIASILAPEIIAILLGSQWSGAVAPFRILALGMFFRTGLKVSSILANGVGAPYRNASVMVIYAALIVAGSLLAVDYGITWVAVATLVALLIAFVMLTRLSLDLTKMRWKDLLRAYRPAVWLTGILALSTIAVAESLRLGGAGPAIILVASGAAIAGITYLLIRLAPGLLGSHGQWALATLKDRMPVIRRLI